MHLRFAMSCTCRRAAFALYAFPLSPPILGCNLLLTDLQNYKQSCANITYSYSTDVLMASCSSSATPEDTSAYKYSTLPDACQCSTNIANIEGNLQCVPESALVPIASASDTCSPLVVLYISQIDKTGSDAPDGVSSSPTVLCYSMLPVAIASTQQQHWGVCCASYLRLLAAHFAS